MTIDQVISLAASIGACLSALAAFLAVKEVAKQRESSYKPELVLVKTLFKGISNPLHKGAMPDFWTTDRESDESIDCVKSFSIPLRNVGLGAAKDVKATWSFPMEDTVALVNDLAQKAHIPAYFELKNGFLSLNSEELGELTSVWRNQQLDSLDFVLPAQIDNSPIELTYPHAYIQIISALIYFSVKSGKLESFPDIPKLNLKLEYSDIGGLAHSAQYLLHTNIVSIVND
ncbi:MAG: hypothetical protein MI867_04580, partial [Pseudomonadales bacterium]|nr:hypothetical protein [Pseudomonadales bacterium]